MGFGQVNLKRMALQDEAHTLTLGHSVPAKASMKVEKGPFIVISGGVHGLSCSATQAAVLGGLNLFSICSIFRRAAGE